MEDERYLYALLGVTVGCYAGIGAIVGVLFYWYEEDFVLDTILSRHLSLREHGVSWPPDQPIAALPSVSTEQLLCCSAPTSRLPAAFHASFGVKREIKVSLFNRLWYCNRFDPSIAGDCSFNVTVICISLVVALVLGAASMHPAASLGEMLRLSSAPLCLKPTSNKEEKEVARRLRPNHSRC